jgi:uncharacterized protein
VRPPTDQIRFTVGGVFSGWAICYLVSSVFSMGVVALSGHADDPVSTWPIWITLVSLLGLWLPFGYLLVWSSQRWATGRFRHDFRLTGRSVDLVGIPIGVASQLILVPLVYLPLRNAFPETFSQQQIEERARELWDRADGGWLVALVVLVAVGAPIMEELVYRGLVQQSLAARFADSLAAVLGALFFAAIHFAPVEFPGLFAFGLVLGFCFHLTGRLACPILAHMAFNVTGLAIAAGV